MKNTKMPTAVDIYNMPRSQDEMDLVYVIGKAFEDYYNKEAATAFRNHPDIIRITNSNSIVQRIEINIYLKRKLFQHRATTNQVLSFNIIPFITEQGDNSSWFESLVTFVIPSFKNAKILG